MNGDDQIQVGQKVEGFVITFITIVIGVLSVECVTTQVLCVLWKIPDMNTTLSNAFMHTCDTIIGAVLGWTAKSAVQKRLAGTDSNPLKTENVNTAENPLPVKEIPA